MSNPYQTPQETEQQDSDKVHIKYELVTDDYHIIALVFIMGRFKVYLDEELVYNDHKWWRLKEVANFEKDGREFCVTAVSKLSTYLCTLTVNGEEVELGDGIWHPPHLAPANDKKIGVLPYLVFFLSAFLSFFLVAYFTSS